MSLAIVILIQLMLAAVNFFLYSETQQVFSAIVGGFCTGLAVANIINLAVAWTLTKTKPPMN